MLLVQPKARYPQPIKALPAAFHFPIPHFHSSLPLRA
jgi:hypothetical protein